MQGDIVSGVLLPLILAFIMYALGLGLTHLDFRRILQQPRALVVGVFSQFVLLPLLCVLLIQAFGLNGVFAVGFMILAACPTGTTSNLLTYLARGDVALALSFTAVASILTVFTLPLVVSWALNHYTGAAAAVHVPVGAMMGQVFVVVGLPVLLGMLTRHFRPALALRLEPLATRAATVLFILVVAAAVAKNWTLLVENFSTLAVFALALNLAAMVGGFAMAWLTRLSQRQAVTVAIETGVQNATLALLIASSVLGNDALGVPGAVYGVLMYLGGLVFAFAMRRVLAGGDPT